MTDAVAVSLIGGLVTTVTGLMAWSSARSSRQEAKEAKEAAKQATDWATAAKMSADNNALLLEQKARENRNDMIQQNEVLAGIEHKTDGTLSEMIKRAEASDLRADILARQVQRLLDAQENGKEKHPDA